MFSNAEKTKKRMFSCTRDDRKIFCEMITPAGNGPFPLVVWAHPFGEHAPVLDHTEIAHHGIAVCAMDFCGGSPDSRSDGASTDMSVLTEAADLQVVLKKMLELPEVDPERIYLLGMSQGGYVATMIAGLGTVPIAGMMLLCPAYILEDLPAQMFGNREIPDRFRVRNMNIGKRYVTDLKQIRIYELMPEYKGPVLIYYGDRDELVPFSYIERAAGQFPDARLVKVEGAGHEDLPVKREEMLLNALVRLVEGRAPEDGEDTEGSTAAEGGEDHMSYEGSHEHTHTHEHLHEHTHTDENGNTYTHSHDHAHTHSHEHGHDHDHCHDHEHHDHDHEHHDHDHAHHDHEHGAGGDPAKAMAMMNYMYKHNDSHLTELTDTVKLLKESGKPVQAIKLEGAAELFKLANRVLLEVLEELKTPEE